MKFSELGLMPLITKSLESMGYEEPTPIQAQAIPSALEGRDVLGCAQTGTGKTCAFATPILQRLARSPKRGERVIRALILTPTRELALQIQENFEAYGKGLPLRSTVIFGGVGQTPQVEKIKKGLDILVATPGRLLDLHGQGLLDLSQVEIFVLDEADRMLDMGFIHDVRRVLKLLPQKKQTLFFSATMPPEVMELVDGLLRDPAKVAVDPISSPVEVIDQCVYFVEKGKKTKLLAQLIQEGRISSALVFTRTKHGANKVAQDLNKQGLTAAAIHGNKSQTARQKALADFKAGEVRILVATDIAARGIDIEELPYVFNYNLPEVPETYVHRIGRTGRAGHEGIAVSFCDAPERDYLKGIEKLIGRKLPVKQNEWTEEAPEAPVKEKKAAVQSKQSNRPKQPKQHQTEQPPKGRQGKKEKAASQPKAEVSAPVETPRKKKFSPPTKTLAEFEAEERAFQERIAQERKERNTIREHGALAGEVIMDATARLLAPRKSVLPVKAAPAPAQKQEATEPKKRRKKGRKEEAVSQPKGGEPQENTGRKKKTAKPEKPAKQVKEEKSAQKGGKAGEKLPQSQPASAGKRAEKRRRGDRPRSVEHRSSRIKDSTEQPSLMKPFYFGPEE